MSKDIFDDPRFKKLMREAFEAKEKTYENKKPSKKFGLIEDSLKLLKQLLEFETPKISLNYDTSDVTIIVENLGFGVSNSKMSTWKEFMDNIDTFEFCDCEKPDCIVAEFTIFDVFEPIK